MQHQDLTIGKVIYLVNGANREVVPSINTNANNGRTYIIKYTVTDPQGNKTELERTVQVLKVVKDEAEKPAKIQNEADAEINADFE